MKAEVIYVRTIFIQRKAFQNPNLADGDMCAEMQHKGYKILNEGTLTQVYRYSESAGAYAFLGTFWEPYEIMPDPLLDMLRNKFTTAILHDEHIQQDIVKIQFINENHIGDITDDVSGFIGSQNEGGLLRRWS